MENAEEILHFLEEFSKRKPKSIPQELNEYLAYVARTGDPVYQWSLVKSLFKEKLLNVITDFYETTPGLDIPPYPNVDPFNYDIMKNMLLERLDAFTAAPFTVQRICELLTYPRKQYNRIDKFMRAVEKNILVVSTREPGHLRHAELENGDPLEPLVNGSDNNSEYNVDVEMEDMSWKENAEQKQNAEPQPSSSDAHISVDDIEARLQAKEEMPMESVQEKPAAQYESVTPPELNVADEQVDKAAGDAPSLINKPVTEEKADITEPPSIPTASEEPKMEIESSETPTDVATAETTAPLVIPEITVDDAEMTEQKLIKQASVESIETKPEQEIIAPTPVAIPPEVKEPVIEPQQPQTLDDSSSDSNKDEIIEPKLISEVCTSSEESSSSSDITDGSSNSPKNDSESSMPAQEDSNQSEIITDEPPKVEKVEVKEATPEPEKPCDEEIKNEPPQVIQSEDYSISDVKSEIPQVTETEPAVVAELPPKSPEIVPEIEMKEDVPVETQTKEEVPEEPKPEVVAEAEPEKVES
ncbi:unnamed protein product [Plutella xylostella]|uniref:(diamondback moth) hypothetical protein n=1 Tax=Plutella xylostella TaxID=51655 RepID=A0A8S4DLK1_PLUXY|nr:unnamed protein product [Plutella xylostella]